VSLTVPQLIKLHERMKTSYPEWLRHAPESYTRDGFFTDRKPVAVTSRYGQNQKIGGSEANSAQEDSVWQEVRRWDEISHVTVALATHIRYASCFLSEWSAI